MVEWPGDPSVVHSFYLGLLYFLGYPLERGTFSIFPHRYNMYLPSSSTCLLVV